MLDKLEVRVPRGAEFSKEFGDLYGELAHSETFYKHFRQSQHYLQVGDLRPFGYSAILHFGNKHDKAGNHKLELIDTGKMGYSHMVGEIERVFKENPESLDVMRVDAAADVEDVSVDWFHRRARARYKQFAMQVGKIEVDTMGKKEMQTIYFGKKPNCIRIYNKVAEHRHQYSQLLRKSNQDSEIPPFAEVFGCGEDAIKTRVERQMAGGRVPHKLTIVGALKRRGHDFNPFDKLEFIMPKAKGLSAEPHKNDYGLSDYMAGMYLRQMFEDHGAQFTRSFLNSDGNRNAEYYLKKFGAFLPPETKDGTGITERELFERYQDSFQRQMAA